MPIDTSPGGPTETAIIEAIKDGLLTAYQDRGPQPDEMEKLARAVAPGIMSALQHVKDTIETLPEP